MKKIMAVLTNFWSDESGLVLVFSALTLPVMLLIMALVIDGGRLYVRHSQIQNLAQQAANSGALELSTLITQQADSARASLCGVVDPPPECANTEALDFLTDSEVSALVLASGNQTQAGLAATNFAKNYDPAKGKDFAVEASDMTIIFYVEPNEFRLHVEIETEAPGFFTELMPGSRTVKSEAISFLDLN